LNEKHFEKQLLPHFQTLSWKKSVDIQKLIKKLKKKKKKNTAGPVS
jgi:hypothetical protein